LGMHWSRGREKVFDERVDKEGNQPISQPPKSEPKKLLLAQPEEQDERRGKAASNESGEGADEVDWIVNERPKEGTTCSQIPIQEQRGNPKSKPGEEDDAKSNSHTPIHAQPNFDDAEFVSRPMDLKNTLLEGQQPPTMANMAKPSNLPFREGIGPPTHTPKPNAIATDAITHEIQEEPLQISLDKSRGGEGSPCINAREHKGGADEIHGKMAMYFFILLPFYKV